MKADPPIDDIRETRRQISAEFDHDPRRLMAHYAEFEKQLQREGKFRFADAPVGGVEQCVLNDKASQKEE
jgi:hypothetical protein